MNTSTATTVNVAKSVSSALDTLGWTEGLSDEDRLALRALGDKIVAAAKARASERVDAPAAQDA